MTLLLLLLLLWVFCCHLFPHHHLELVFRFLLRFLLRTEEDNPEFEVLPANFQGDEEQNQLQTDRVHECTSDMEC